MTTSVSTKPPVTAQTAPMTVTPVVNGDREVGAWIVGPDRATYRPVIDVTRLAATIVVTAGAVAVAVAAVAAAARRRPAIGAVTMGPGGWVSVKGATKPALRSTGRRPWWAHLLKAEPLDARR
jgi:hypothetical protein